MKQSEILRYQPAEKTNPYPAVAWTLLLAVLLSWRRASCNGAPLGNGGAVSDACVCNRYRDSGVLCGRKMQSAAILLWIVPLLLCSSQ